MVRLVKINLLLDSRLYTISLKANWLLDIGYYTSHPKKNKAITYINFYRLKDVLPCLFFITCQIKFFAWSRCNIHFTRGIVKCTLSKWQLLSSKGSKVSIKTQRIKSPSKVNFNIKQKPSQNGFRVHCSIQLVIKTTQIIYIHDVML